MHLSQGAAPASDFRCVQLGHDALIAISPGSTGTLFARGTPNSSVGPASIRLLKRAVLDPDIQFCAREETGCFHRSDAELGKLALSEQRLSPCVTRNRRVALSCWASSRP